MKRRALLIEASQIPGCSDLPGARADVSGFHRYLASYPGGAWNDDEIVCLSHPSKSILEAHLAAASVADYCFIAFSGHGEHVKGRLSEDTKIQINKTDEFSARALASGFDRGTVVVDSCRNIRVQLSLRESVKYSKAMSFSDDASIRYRHRQLFNNTALAAEEGVVFMFGCSVGQSANDFSLGGAFSFALHDSAASWSVGQHAPAILDTNGAFSLAHSLVTSEVSKQTPVMDGAIRRKKHFPFAVVA